VVSALAEEGPVVEVVSVLAEEVAVEVVSQGVDSHGDVVDYLDLGAASLLV
jgi:hypothetical protein